MSVQILVHFLCSFYFVMNQTVQSDRIHGLATHVFWLFTYSVDVSFSVARRLLLDLLADSSLSTAKCLTHSPAYSTARHLTCLPTYNSSLPDSTLPVRSERTQPVQRRPRPPSAQTARPSETAPESSWWQTPAAETFRYAASTYRKWAAACC